MNEAQQILFEKYLNGELNSEETAAFEARLKSEDKLKEDFGLFQSMNAFTDEKAKNKNALDALKEVHTTETNTVHENIVTSVKSQKRFNIKRFAIIALVLSAIAFILYQKMIKSVGQGNLYAEIMENHYDLPPNQGTRSLSPNSTKLDSAIHYFDVRDFEKSRETFQIFDNNDEEKQYYLAHIYFLEQEYKQCINWFDQIGENVVTEELIDIKIYCYLLTGQDEEARKLYELLSPSNKNKIKVLF